MFNLIKEFDKSKFIKKLQSVNLRNIISNKDLGEFAVSVEHILPEIINYKDGYFLKNLRFRTILLDKWAGSDSAQEITELEWDINELYISDSDDVHVLAYKGIKILMGWKLILQQNYPKTNFCICLSVDIDQDLEKPSINIKFWNMRPGIHTIIDIANLDKYNQPLALEFV